MALNMNLLSITLLVTGYSLYCVDASRKCTPENVYSYSCINRTFELQDNRETCATSLTYEVLDRKAGLVGFSLLLPFNEPNSSTDVTVRSLKNADEAGCSLDVEGVHSKFTLIVDDNGLVQPKNGSDVVSCKPNEVKKVEWKSSYMFTGCYQIDLNLNYNCTSKPFRIESDFTKEVFADLTLPMITKTEGQNVFAIYNFGIKFCHNYPQTTIVYLRSKSIHSGKRLACCITGDPVSNCHWFREEHEELVDCSCTWTEGSLECEFIDVLPGNYSIELDIMDTRCNRGTIWTKNWDKNWEPCLWKHDNIIVKNNTSHTWPFDVAVPSFSSPWLLSVVGLTAAAVAVSVYWRYRQKRVSPIIPQNSQVNREAIDVHEKLLDPPKVLLLYARDCDSIMSVMANFRRILRDNISAQVYDMWEDKTRDIVDSQGDVWSLKFLHSENVRVVLVATPISRRIEEAVMDGRDILYFSPDNRDETFFFALRTAISLVPKIREPCNKFIVVRLDHKSCSEDILLNFSTNSTVYTLPTHLQKLILHLLQSQSVNVALNLKNTDSLYSQMDVFRKFISSHPAYADELLVPLEKEFVPK